MSSKMSIVLVNPPRCNGVPVIREERCEVMDRYSVLPPYSLLQLAAIFRKEDHSVRLIDANGENLTYDELEEKVLMSINIYTILIFRFTPTTFDHDMRIAELFKKRFRKFWTIGICSSLSTVAETVLESSPYMDFYVRHNYETVAPELVNTLASIFNNSLSKEELGNVNGITYRLNGVVKSNADSKFMISWDELPLPAYDLLSKLKRYHINTPTRGSFSILYSSKGCPFRCTYCTVARTQVKTRNAESILEELELLRKVYNVKMVSFFDETFTMDRSRVMVLCDRMRASGLNIKWYCNTRVELLDEELLGLMYSSGCRGISFGIESGSQKILDNVEKGSTVKEAENAIMWAKAAGLKVFCSFIFGLPGETQETIMETRNFVNRTLPTAAQFNVAVPYPGTRLFADLGCNEKVLDWRGLYQEKSIVQTCELSIGEIDSARMSAYSMLYKNLGWWKQNILHVLKHPGDFSLASRFVLKIGNNFLVHGMKDAH